ncbi:MAG: XRE family transcriptional regulator [Syntrophobacteraceae bacterium]|nr:XRE family transcriptional regulator [Syntrophobacteraceae bacterium]
MARKFSQLEAKMSPEAISRSDAHYREMVAEMPLHELRRARGVSQEMLAKELHIKQPNVAKMEKRTDIYISTLRSAIEAMGGTLDIVARFPDGSVKISNFSSIEESAGTGSSDASTD